jgi:1-aminocyclopropane-1-carboxylate deaminase/D-cysteine desulfhydrase-like pyridoxal-dependent ACC family enzyme
MKEQSRRRTQMVSLSAASAHDEMSRRELEKAIEKLPRVRLANLPTPLEEAPRLSKLLGGPRIFFKRDDLTGMPLSGNKTRMFEFSLGHAIKEGAEVVVGASNVTANYLRQLVFACRRLGLESHIILVKVSGESASFNSTEIDGNLLLELLGGDHVDLVEVQPGGEDVSEIRGQELLRAKVKELQARGRRVYGLRSTDHAIALEAVGYVNCALELSQQFDEQNIIPNHLVICSSDTSQLGLLVGARWLGERYQITSFRSSRPSHEVVSHIARLVPVVCKVLGCDVRVSADEVLNTADYVGEGYGKCTREGLEALKLVARTEGLLLDPIYTSKAMAGLIDHIKKGRIKKGETVVFVHTGGVPGLYNYRKELARYLQGEEGLPTFDETTAEVFRLRVDGKRG